MRNVSVSEVFTPQEVETTVCGLSEKQRMLLTVTRMGPDLKGVGIWTAFKSQHW
jgi:hypothetical protein